MDFLDKIKSFLVGVDLTTELIPSGTVFDLAEAAGVNRNIARTRLARLWRKGEIRRFKEHKQQFGVWFVLDKVPFHPHRASVTYREINRDEVIDLWKSSMKHIKSC